MVSNLTDKQLSFCEEYIKLRDVKESALKAGYSDTYAKTKAFLLIKETKISDKIQELEKAYYQDYFKKSAIDAAAVLEDIMKNSLNDSARLKAVDMIFKQAGVITDSPLVEINNREIKVTFV